MTSANDDAISRSDSINSDVFRTVQTNNLGVSFQANNMIPYREAIRQLERMA